jgi:hypothetical protein
MKLLFLSIALTTIACSGNCDTTRYEDIDSVSAVSCTADRVTVTGVVCFGAPDSCDAGVSGTRLKFAVRKYHCSSGAESTGCASNAVAFSCAITSLPAGTYDVAGGRKVQVDTNKSCKLL